MEMGVNTEMETEMEIGGTDVLCPRLLGGDYLRQGQVVVFTDIIRNVMRFENDAHAMLEEKEKYRLRLIGKKFEIVDPNKVNLMRSQDIPSPKEDQERKKVFIDIVIVLRLTIIFRQK